MNKPHADPMAQAATLADTGPVTGGAAAAFDRRTGDVGNIVEFGHLNLRVPEQAPAISFYVSGLGLTRDPYLNTGVRNAWINVGRSQFHLPLGPAQVLGGIIGLEMPDLDALVQRLARVAPELAGTRFAYERSAGRVELSCPWGNRLCVQSPDASRCGRLALGMPWLQIDVARGTAAGIARFYETVLGALVRLDEDPDDRGARTACVSVGTEEWLRFRETSASLPPWDGHHVQLSVAAFSAVHRRLQERGLVTEESNAHQYRFEEIVDPASGELLARLGHELRSMRHPLFGRRLVNRNPSLATQTYAEGHEAAPWLGAPW